jgi:hypothetical protein
MATIAGEEDEETDGLLGRGSDRIKNLLTPEVNSGSTKILSVAVFCYKFRIDFYR